MQLLLVKAGVLVHVQRDDRDNEDDVPHYADGIMQRA